MDFVKGFRGDYYPDKAVVKYGFLVYWVVTNYKYLGTCMQLRVVRVHGLSQITVIPVIQWNKVGLWLWDLWTAFE
jgi:hypothetical protein